MATVSPCAVDINAIETNNTIHKPTNAVDLHRRSQSTVALFPDWLEMDLV
jgi:hypothetical protein